MKYLDELTPRMRAAMEGHASEWIAHGLSCEPADMELFTDAARRCYEFAGLPWHGNVVRVPSPLVGALAAPIAAQLLKSRAGEAFCPLARAVPDVLKRDMHRYMTDETYHVDMDSVHRATSRAVDHPVQAAVMNAVHDTVRAADSAVGGAVDGAVGDAVAGAVSGSVHRAVIGAVSDAPYSAVRSTMDGTAWVDADRALGDVVYEAVDGAVDDALYDGIGVAVRDLVPSVARGWWHMLRGNLSPFWQARTSFFRDVCGLEIPGDLWDRARAYEDTSKAAGWWWPHPTFTIVCDRPAFIHLERVGEPGWGSHRLHCETGPAIAWRDGWALHFWHGTPVPADLIEGNGWSVERILGETNAEIRRCAIERIGWDVFIDRAGLTPCAPAAPDPGNPGQTLTLYDIPEQIFDEPVRVLLCTNGSVERDGTRRRFGLTVPGSISDPIAAAAWTYGLGPSEYAQCEARR